MTVIHTCPIEKRTPVQREVKLLEWRKVKKIELEETFFSIFCYISSALNHRQCCCCCCWLPSQSSFSSLFPSVCFSSLFSHSSSSSLIQFSSIFYAQLHIIPTYTTVEFFHLRSLGFYSVCATLSPLRATYIRCMFLRRIEKGSNLQLVFSRQARCVYFVLRFFLFGKKISVFLAPVLWKYADDRDSHSRICMDSGKFFFLLLRGVRLRVQTQLCNIVDFDDGEKIDRLDRMFGVHNPNNDDDVCGWVWTKLDWLSSYGIFGRLLSLFYYVLCRAILLFFKSRSLHVPTICCCSSQ